VADKGSSSAGGVIGVVLLLAVLVWATGVMVSPHWNMAHDEVLRYRDVINQVNDELSLHRIAAGTILVPRYDDSLDVFVSRSAYQSVPYPDRDELAGAISDIWCTQVSTLLFPVVHFRDVETGSTLSTNRCFFQSRPDITGTYSGTVHNNNVNADAPFEAQLVTTAQGIQGCMQVAFPLVGTGPIKGSLNNGRLVFDLTAPDVRISFDGTQVGHSVVGRYTVTSNGQTGNFRIHQDEPRVDIGFDPHNCPR